VRARATRLLVHTPHVYNQSYARKNNHLRIERFLSQPQTCGQKRRYASKMEAQHVLEEQELLNRGFI